MAFIWKFHVNGEEEREAAANCTWEDSWVQCWGSVTFWYGSGSSDPYLWQTDPDADPGGPKRYGSYGSGSGCGFGTDKKSKKLLEIMVFLTIFDWWWKYPEPDPYLWLKDPDADPWGPRTYGFYGYGYGCGSGRPNTGWVRYLTWQT